MFQICVRIFCAVSLATAAARAVMINIPLEDTEFLKNGIRTLEKPSKFKNSHAENNHKQLGRKYKQSVENYDPADQTMVDGDKVRNSDPVRLNKPISLWGAVNNSVPPVETRIAVLNEPIGLWNAVNNARPPSEIRLAARNDANQSGGGDPAASDHANPSFHFGNGQKNGSLVGWWEEWNPGDAGRSIPITIVDDSRTVCIAAARPIELAVGPAIPDSGTTFSFLVMGVMVLTTLRRKLVTI